MVSNSAVYLNYDFMDWQSGLASLGWICWPHSCTCHQPGCDLLTALLSGWPAVNCSSGGEGAAPLWGRGVTEWESGLSAAGTWELLRGWTVI